MCFTYCTLLFKSAFPSPLLRLALSRTRLLTRAAKGFMCRSHSKSGDSIGESDNENKDYIPLVGCRSIHVNSLSTCKLTDTNLKEENVRVHGYNKQKQF